MHFGPQPPLQQGTHQLSPRQLLIFWTACSIYTTRSRFGCLDEFWILSVLLGGYWMDLCEMNLRKELRSSYPAETPNEGHPWSCRKVKKSEWAGKVERDSWLKYKHKQGDWQQHSLCEPLSRVAWSYRMEFLRWTLKTACSQGEHQHVLKISYLVSQNFNASTESCQVVSNTI